MKETFVGQAITPVGMDFSVSDMAQGKPGFPQQFTWNGRKFSLKEIVQEWKESGPCHHGSGERYVRKHWYRITTTDGFEMKIYFERQARSSGGSRWRLYSVRNTQRSSAARAGSAISPQVAEVRNRKRNGSTDSNMKTEPC